MGLARWIIAQANLIAIVLGISLSGFGMAQAHTAMMLDTPSMDHAAHVDMDHTGHDMTSTGQDPSHEGHTSCPMIACCHTGGTCTQAVPALTDAIALQPRPTVKAQLHKAEPESTNKPPKHI